MSVAVFLLMGIMEYQNYIKNSMDKRTKDCYDEVMICHGVDNFNCKAFENIVAVLSRYLEREKVKDNETV